MLRRVHLHGNLKSLHEGPIEVVAATVAEAIKAISLQIKGFKPNAVQGYRRVKVVGFETVESILAPSDTVDLHVFPQLCGGKTGGFFQILIGAALIAASFVLPEFMAAFAPLLWKVGALLMIGGLLQIINAPKRDKSDGDKNKSYYLGAPKNTVAIGTRIPILYGRRRVGGQFLSFNISSVDTGL